MSDEFQPLLANRADRFRANNQPNNFNMRNDRFSGICDSAAFLCGGASVGCLLITGIILLFCSIATVPAGNVGVKTLFGKVYADYLDSGLHFMNPLAQVSIMSVRYQTITYSENVSTAEGMDVHLEAAAIVYLQPKDAVAVYERIGTDYLNLVVIPQFRSILREITSAHNARDLYNAEAREAMTSGLQQDLRQVLAPYGVAVQDTPLKKLELPPTLLRAIESKLAAEQDAQKMEYIIQKQKSEAERQVIEAKGIAAYQDIIGSKLTPHLLQWKGIEATIQLASSANAKVVVIGGSDTNGMPLIFNPDLGSPAPALPSAQPTSNTAGAAVDSQLSASHGEL